MLGPFGGQNDCLGPGIAKGPTEQRRFPRTVEDPTFWIESHLEILGGAIALNLASGTVVCAAHLVDVEFLHLEHRLHRALRTFPVVAS